MRILITGANGFIGRNLLLGLPSWLDDDATIFGLDINEGLKDFVGQQSPSPLRAEVCDLCDPDALQELAGKWGREFDMVVYLAGNGDPAYSVPHPEEDLKRTVLGLILFLKVFSAGRFIYFSSGAVYDGLSGEVSPESRLDPRLPYAVGKLASEQYIKFFQKQDAVKEYVILRFFGAYGPYEPPRKIYTKLTKAFYLEKKKEFIIRGDGSNLIDAMFVDDTVRAVARVLKSRVRNEVVDFCVGRPVTLRGLVEEAARVFGIKDLQVICEGKVPEYITFHPSADKMRQLFDFTPRVPLAEGLPKLGHYLQEKEH